MRKVFSDGHGSQIDLVRLDLITNGMCNSTTISPQMLHFMLIKTSKCIRVRFFPLMFRYVDPGLWFNFEMLEKNLLLGIYKGRILIISDATKNIILGNNCSEAHNNKSINWKIWPAEALIGLLS